jgi:hypothetical protein
MMKLPEDLDMAAQEADDAMGEGMAARVPAPERPLKPSVLAAFRKAIQMVCKVMGVACDVPAAPEIDPETARYYAMIEAAASAYGQPLPVGLEGLSNDRAITADTAAIMGLASDRDFKAFLQEQAPEGEAPEMEEPSAEVEKPMNFASRMR